MTASLTHFSQNEIFAGRNTSERLDNSLEFAASDFWLDSIQQNASQSAADRLDEMRRMSGRIVQRQKMYQIAQGSNAPSIAETSFASSSRRHSELCRLICQAIYKNPEGVVITIMLADGSKHIVAGYCRQAVNQFHFFDPQQGEYVADEADDLHLALIGLVSSRLKDLYALAQSIQSHARNLH